MTNLGNRDAVIQNRYDQLCTLLQKPKRLVRLSRIAVLSLTLAGNLENSPYPIKNTFALVHSHDTMIGSGYEEEDRSLTVKLARPAFSIVAEIIRRSLTKQNIPESLYGLRAALSESQRGEAIAPASTEKMVKLDSELDLC